MSGIQGLKNCCQWRLKRVAVTNKYVGICGQGPSDHPDLAKWLMEQGTETVSLNPDSVLDTWMFLANAASGLRVMRLKT